MDSAQEEFNEAIRLQPYNDTAHLALAKLYLALHKSTEAEQEAWRALRLNPSNPEAALVAGDALVQATRWPKAESVYDEIVRQLPGQPVGYVKLGGLRRLQGRPSEAATFFAQALSRAPDDLVILQDYLVALVESNQAHQADRVLDQYLTKASHDPNLWRLAGRVHLSQRRTDQAEQALRKAVDLAPDLALVYYELGQLYLVQRKLSAAESAFQAALKKDETNSEVHTALGLVLAAQGRVDLANTHYRRAVQLDRHNVVAANNLAASLTEQQEFDDALGLALAAHDRAPSNPGIQDTLGWIYYKKNRFEDAHRLLAEASAALPQHPTVRYHHAMLLSKIGKQEAALSELKTALSLPGGFPEADRAARMVAANKIDE
jgi:Flp pilus assembly protein TadD